MSIYFDYYLKFPDEATFRSTLKKHQSASGLTSYICPIPCKIEVGIKVRKNIDGNKVIEEGYFVNVRARKNIQLPQLWLNAAVNPKTPYREFIGGEADKFIPRK